MSNELLVLCTAYTPKGLSTSLLVLRTAQLGIEVVDVEANDDITNDFEVEIYG